MAVQISACGHQFQVIGTPKAADVIEASILELYRETEKNQPLTKVRYTTSHPVEFSDRLINVYAEVPKLVNHLHLSVQSSSAGPPASMPDSIAFAEKNNA